MCLFVFLKMLLRMHFLPISNIFLSFQTNIIIKIPIYKPKETKKTKRKSQFHKPNTRLRERERERERERKYRVEVVNVRLIKRSSDSELEREKQRRWDWRRDLKASLKQRWSNLVTMVVVNGWLGTLVWSIHLWVGQGGLISSWVGHGGAMVSNDDDDGLVRGGMKLRWSHE